MVNREFTGFPIIYVARCPAPTGRPCVENRDEFPPHEMPGFCQGKCRVIEIVVVAVDKHQYFRPRGPFETAPDFRAKEPLRLKYVFLIGRVLSRLAIYQNERRGRVRKSAQFHDRPHLHLQLGRSILLKTDLYQLVPTHLRNDPNDDRAKRHRTRTPRAVGWLAVGIGFPDAICYVKQVEIVSFQLLGQFLEQIPRRVTGIDIGHGHQRPTTCATGQCEQRYRDREPLQQVWTRTR